MPKKLYMYSYSNSSKSAKLLKEALGCQFILHENSKFKHATDKAVINWGSSKLPTEAQKYTLFNKPQYVLMSADKILTFQNFDTGPLESQPRVVPWTTDRKMAEGWLDEGFTVVARTVTDGFDGNGIVVVGPDDGPEGLPEASLYTKYVPKATEWRLYYAFGKLIDVLRKVCPKDHTPPTWKIRTEANGFIYTRKSSVPCPADCITQGDLAFKKSGLDFCGIDVIFNSHSKSAYILETNTAPGIVGKTVEYFAEAFKNAAA